MPAFVRSLGCCCQDVDPLCCCVESITINFDGYWQATIPLIKLGQSTQQGYTNETICTYGPAASQYNLCDLGSYLHYNIIEEATFARNFYYTIGAFDWWLRGNELWKDVLYWTDILVKVHIRSDGNMKLRLFFYARQFLIQGYETGFEGTQKNHSNNCATVIDETEDIGLDDWEPCDTLTNLSPPANKCFDVTWAVPLMPNEPFASDRIPHRKKFYDLEFDFMTDWTEGDCATPVEDVNDDVFIGPYWGDPIQTTTQYCTLPTGVTETNVANNRCFGFESLAGYTFRTGLQAAPIVVPFSATINYC